jgi:hypothetical protein
MTIEKLQPIRDQIFDQTWKEFINTLPSKKNQRIWSGRKKEFEFLFKQAWNSGAQVVLDLLKEATQSRLVVSQNIPNHNILRKEF